MSDLRNPDNPGHQGSYKDLAKRAGSAALLAATALLLTVISPWTFAALVAAGALILAWEWEKLTRSKPSQINLAIHAATAIAACGAALFGHGLYAVAILCAGAIISAAVPQSTSSRVWSASGILYLGAALVILIALRNDEAYGLWSVLLLFIVVWSADTAAYFAGRSFGGLKLAPRISPGKTWSGFAGGLIVPIALTFAYGTYLDLGNPYVLSAVGAFLALASQLGDLVQSAIKRNFGAKDSGSILPGHGGLFDRVDGLIGAAIAAGILLLCRAGFLSPRELLLWN